MSKLAYDYTHRELMDAYWKAVAQAAVSNSGLIIDVTGGSRMMEAYYLHGVLLSRLEGKERPFTRGDHVRISPKATYICHSVNSVGEYYSRGQANLEKVHEVVRVFYEKEGKWTLSFKDEDEEEEKYRYPADRFEKVEQKQSAPA